VATILSGGFPSENVGTPGCVQVSAPVDATAGTPMHTGKPHARGTFSGTVGVVQRHRGRQVGVKGTPLTRRFNSLETPPSRGSLRAKENRSHCTGCYGLAQLNLKPLGNLERLHTLSMQFQDAAIPLNSDRIVATVTPTVGAGQRAIARPSPVRGTDVPRACLTPECLSPLGHDTHTPKRATPLVLARQYEHRRLTARPNAAPLNTREPLSGAVTTLRTVASAVALATSHLKDFATPLTCQSHATLLGQAATLGGTVLTSSYRRRGLILTLLAQWAGGSLSHRCTPACSGTELRRNFATAPPCDIKRLPAALTGNGGGSRPLLSWSSSATQGAEPPTAGTNVATIWVEQGFARLTGTLRLRWLLLRQPVTRSRAIAPTPLLNLRGNGAKHVATAGSFAQSLRHSPERARAFARAEAPFPHRDVDRSGLKRPSTLGAGLLNRSFRYTSRGVAILRAVLTPTPPDSRRKSLKRPLAILANSIHHVVSIAGTRFNSLETPIFALIGK